VPRCPQVVWELDKDHVLAVRDLHLAWDLDADELLLVAEVDRDLVPVAYGVRLHFGVIICYRLLQSQLL
jgi:hypothetical protein